MIKTLHIMSRAPFATSIIYLTIFLEEGCNQSAFHTIPSLMPAFLTHSIVRGLDAAEGGTFLHHEAEQTREDGRDRPRGVPSVWMEVCDGQT